MVTRIVAYISGGAGTMKFISLLALLLVSAVALANGDPNAPNACRFDDCKLPNCRCSSYNIPGDLALKDTPQFVTVSFPGSVNVNNIVTYRDILYNRVNSNGCPVGATFFVNHEYNNYVLVNELYNRGFEIGLSSITHQTPKTYWQEATYDVIKREIVDQRLQMAHFANIPLDSIKGVRLPFLQLAGNNSFQVMADYGLEYDYTWVHTLRANPAPWPHTLDYRSTLRCDIPPCPTASIPGVWIKPLISWFDQRGTPCSTLDACYFVPDYENEEKWFLFILNNFQTHYFGNRAPFSFFVNESFLTTFPAVRRAFVRFMDVINNLEDVFTVIFTLTSCSVWFLGSLKLTHFRAIYNLGCRKSLREKFKEINNIMTVPCQFIYEYIMYVRINLNLFGEVSDRHNYQTRQQDRLSQPFFRLIKYSCNKIPEEIKHLNERKF
uniref:SFRICE_034167 n=1 Tax=Spodoptera frugiperda TaxID=7108 RepID=A0A2H1WDN2_SPOFR